MAEKKMIRFGSAIFCNFASTEDSGKVNCTGVFTSLLAWAYPSSVKFWHSVVTIYDLPQGTSSISVSISSGRSKKTTLATVDVENRGGDAGNVINIPINYNFKKEGYFFIHFNIIGITKTLKVPIKVVTQPWPEFSKREIEFMRKNPSEIGSIRANVICSGCSQPYIFEEILVPGGTVPHGVQPFPELGKFQCDTCGRELDLKDIQGQVRSSIKAIVASARKGRI